MENFVLILLIVGMLLSVGQAYLAPEAMGRPYAMAASGQDPRCPPTAEEPLGPFYEPGAPASGHTEGNFELVLAPEGEGPPKTVQ